MDVSAVDVTQVYTTLTAALSFNNSSETRKAAEAQLRSWENDSAPGFIGSLLKIATEVQSVEEDSRLLAIVVAKNAVGSSWRKVVASREWSRVPEEEKAFIRQAAMMVLMNDPSERVAMQSGLLVANIARFDVPRPWSSLLSDLVAASSMSSPTELRSKNRALATLKHTVRGLRTKRFIVDAPAGVSALSTQELAEISRNIDDDRSTLYRQEKELLGPLRSEWEQNLGAFLAKGQDWEARGQLAVAGLSVIREVLLVVPDFFNIEDNIKALLQEGAQAASSIAAPLFAISNVNVDGDVNRTIMSKTWERLLQCGLVAMDQHPLTFAEFLPAWITLCINTALLGMDANAVHHIRPKSRVLLTRFVARALLQQLYRPESERHRGISVTMQLRQQGKLREAVPHLNAAADCLDSLFTEENGHCAALVHAVVSKYLVLSGDDLAEWEADAEGFARQVDVETSPDADTPRPCGVALLECMMERNNEPVANAIVALASQLQSQPLSVENILMREATYHAIGECFPHLRNKVDFKAWYESELRLMLQSQELTGLHGDILRARALWLIGVCGDELQPAPWADAFSLAVQHIRSNDPVVSLMAVSAVTAMVGTVLEEQQFVLRSPEDKKMWLEEMDAPNLPPGQDLAAQADTEFHAHMGAITQAMDAIIMSCFALLPQLGEVESMVRVVQCVSAAIELLGDKISPHLGTITNALPQVWSVISQRTGEGTGALTRLQASLIAMVAHLIAKLGTSAMQDPHVAAIMLPLLEHATNPISSESEPLIDDGLRLWLAVLTSSSVLAPEVQQLLTTRFIPLLRRGKDNPILYRIAEGHLLHGGTAVLTPFLADLAAAISKSLNQASEAMQPKNEGGRPAPLQPLPQDIANEALSALSFLNVLQRVYDALPAELEAPVQIAAGLLAQDYGGGILRLPPRSVTLLESCIEILNRLAYKSPQVVHALCAGNTEAENRLLDRWIVISSSKDVGEILIPALGQAGRTRRHNTAVGLSALLFSDACPGFRNKDRAAQALALGLKCVKEHKLFIRDQQRVQELRPADAAHADQTVLRRLELARTDPLRAVDVVDCVRATTMFVAGWMGQEQLVASLGAIDPAYKEQIQSLLAGQLPYDVETAAALEFEHAML